MDLPKHREDWQLNRLGDLLRPSVLTYADFNGSQNPSVLSLTKNDGLIAQSERFGHSVAIDDLSRYKFVYSGWLVYNPMVIWEGAVHVLYEPACGVVSPAYEVWEPNDIDSRYLDYMLKTPGVMDEYRRLSAGGVMRRRIVSAKDFCSIQIPIPVGTVKDRLIESLDSISNNFDDALEQLLRQTLEHLE